MSLSLKVFPSFCSQIKHSGNLATALLSGHDEDSRNEALDAVDILIKYKATVHEFTDEIVEFWPLPRRVMERYRFSDVEQLNEWLDDQR
ncbi:MAG: hypothetical protein K9L22_06980 [Methylococcaceae bacterium]|nr:hypothetical protein [Methylococcaceae bacterium]